METAAASARANLESIVDRDFVRIANMKMNAVFIRHCDPDDLPAVLAAAAQHRLKAVVSDPVAIRYLRCGTPKVGLLAGPDGLPSHRSIAARYIGQVVDDETYRRACRIAASAKRARPPIATCVTIEASSLSVGDETVFDYLIWHDAPPAVGAEPAGRRLVGGVHRVECLQHRKDELATVRQWLAGYHLGLLYGRTEGVVFDAYRSLPGNWHGIVRQNQPPSPERIAMFRRITSRARLWGKVLDGLEAGPVRSLSASPPELEAALLANDRRQCLIVVNKSPTRFVRTALTFSAMVSDVPIRRAVTIATAEDTIAGPVFHVHRGELSIPVELAPGEARLYELF